MKNDYDKNVFLHSAIVKEKMTNAGDRAEGPSDV